MAHGSDLFTEVINSRAGVIRARGHLTVQAADLLSGAVLALHEGGTSASSSTCRVSTAPKTQVC